VRCNDLKQRGMDIKRHSDPARRVQGAGREARAPGPDRCRDRQGPRSLQAKPDQIRKQIEEFAQSYENPGELIRYYFSDRNRLAEVEAIVVEQNVVDWALAGAKVTDKVLGFDELMGQGSSRRCSDLWPSRVPGTLRGVRADGPALRRVAPRAGVTGGAPAQTRRSPRRPTGPAFRSCGCQSAFRMTKAGAPGFPAARPKRRDRMSFNSIVEDLVNPPGPAAGTPGPWHGADGHRAERPR
jgi:hypothetical protein